ncbi:MAG: hydrogenase iron-sulfur subunit [Deltaproteobacteria bacterium]|nr:MAG: hydrogenase iron-sulfur subunit [Deltaproteobacteria bacterium]
MSEFVPKLVAFCCDQSGYPAANMAGTLKLRLPESVEIVRVPCAGRIETTYLLKALEKGADGVLIFSCHEENCQYLIGNNRAKRRFSYARQWMERIGIEKERLEFCPMATNCGVSFAETLQQKWEALSKLGPHPSKII